MQLALYRSQFLSLRRAENNCIDVKTNTSEVICEFNALKYAPIFGNDQFRRFTLYFANNLLILEWSPLHDTGICLGKMKLSDNIDDLLHLVEQGQQVQGPAAVNPTSKWKLNLSGQGDYDKTIEVKLLLSDEARDVILAALRNPNLKPNPNLYLQELRVVTYNVCWECMAATPPTTGSAQKYSKDWCFLQGQNICRPEAVDLLLNTYPDLVGLQEADPSLLRDITSANSSLRAVYEPQNQMTAYGAILYNQEKLQQIGKSAFGYAHKDKGRPMLGAIFQERSPTPQFIIFFVSVHMPHYAHDLKKNFSFILNKLKSEHSKSPHTKHIKPRVIIVGDFNQPFNSSLSFRRIKLGSQQLEMKAANYDNYSTCCISPQNHAYGAAVDDVLYDSKVFVKGNWHFTTPPNLQTKTSDHSIFGCDLILT